MFRLNFNYVEEKFYQTFLMEAVSGKTCLRPELYRLEKQNGPLYGLITDL